MIPPDIGLADTYLKVDIDVRICLRVRSKVLKPDELPRLKPLLVDLPAIQMILGPANGVMKHHDDHAEKRDNHNGNDWIKDRARATILDSHYEAHYHSAGRAEYCKQYDKPIDSFRPIHPSGWFGWFFPQPLRDTSYLLSFFCKNLWLFYQ